MTADLALVDSVTALSADHAGRVIVTGSHGGVIAAAYVAAMQVRAAVFNDAGRGLDDAGVAGLAVLDPIGIAACAVAHTSARIGDAHDTLESGVVSACNDAAARCGVVAGVNCREAARALAIAAWSRLPLTATAESRIELVAAEGNLARVTGCDSIGLVEARDTGTVLVIGSHGALHGGDPRSALPVMAKGAFFHDAGRGKDDAGTGRLRPLSARGVAAAVVDYHTARIGDARSLWATGIVSVVNATAQKRAVHLGMTVQEAARLLRRA